MAGADNQVVADQDDIRCALPDTLIGIGDGGKQVVYSFLQQDWILEEALEPRGIDPQPPNLDAYVIDTAKNDIQTDRTNEQNINQRIRQKAEELEHPNPGNSASLTYINPAEATASKYVSRVGLTDANRVGEIVRASGLQNWWVKDNPNFTTDNYDQGVVRRRALSKALYHASQTGDAPIDDINNNGMVYIVAGLGGGTGSGTFLDIAKQLDTQNNRITLIGILPGQSEGPEYDANAYAVLSELEYLSLTDQSPFYNQILIPYGPADDDEEFDEAVTNTIVSHCELQDVGNESQYFQTEGDSGPGKHAPFTFAVPQALRYDAPQVVDSEQRVREFNQEKSSALDIEEQLYEQIYRLLSDPERLHDLDIDGAEAYDRETIPADIQDLAEALEKRKGGADAREVSDERFSLDRKEAVALEQRLEDIEAMLEEDIFDQLEYSSHTQIAQRIETIREQEFTGDDIDEMSDSERVGRLLDALKGPIAAEVEQGDEGLDEGDREFGSVVRREILAICRRADLLRALHLINVDQSAAFREAVRAAIHRDRDSMVYAQDADRRRNDLEDTYDSLEESTEVLADTVTAVTSERDDALRNWRDEVEPYVEGLVAVDTNRKEVERLTEELIQGLEQLERNLNSNDDADLDAQPLDFDQFSRLNNLLGTVGAEQLDHAQITQTTEQLSKMRRATRNAGESGGILPFGGPDDNHEVTFNTARGSLNPGSLTLFTVESSFGERFSCTFTESAKRELRKLTVGKLDERREEIVDHIVEMLARYGRQAVSQDGLETAAALNDANIQLTLGLNLTDDDYRGRLEDALVDDDDRPDPVDFGQKLTPRDGRFSGESATGLLDALSGETSIPGADVGPVVDDAFTAAFVTPVEERLADVESQLERVASERALFRGIRAIVTGAGKKYTENRTADIELDVSFDDRTSESFTYIDHEVPDDRGLLLQPDDIADADVFDEERIRIESKLREYAQNASGQLLPLDRTHIEVSTAAASESEGSTDTQYNHYVRAVYMSRAFAGDARTAPGDDRTYFDGENTIKDAIQNNSVDFTDDGAGYDEIKVRYGPDWLVGLTTFVGGVFLDNISLVRPDSGGYKYGYDSEARSKGEDVIVRHTHGIDGHDDSGVLDGTGTGFYVYRDSLVNTSMNTSEIDLFVRNTAAEIEKELLENRIERKTFESTVDVTYPKR